MEADTKGGETMWAMKGKKILTSQRFRCWELCQETLIVELLNFFIWSSVDNKLLGVNKDTVLNLFNGDSSLSRSKYHANQSLAD